MQPTSLPAAVPAAPDEVDLFGKLSGTRRTFIRGIAAAGASTAVATALDQAGILDLFADEALAEASGSSAFSNFTALAASKSDVLEVPAGFRADVLIGWGDAFANTDGTAYRYGFNNDFLAFFPLPAGSTNATEGVIFVNHEYPSPFFQNGKKPGQAKTGGSSGAPFPACRTPR